MRNFGEYRALFLESGVDPRAVDTMSLAELSSMFNELRKRSKSRAPKQAMDGDSFDRLKASIRDAGYEGVKLH